MKKILILIFFSTFSSWVMAQTEKGNILIGAGTTLGLGQSDGLMGLAFNSSTTELANGVELKNRMTSFFISSKGGYFIFDRFATGLELAISTSSGTTQTSGLELESNFSFLGAGPFVRYYFPSGKLLPFAEINSLFGARSEETSGSGIQEDSKFSVANVGGGLGLAFLLGTRSSLDLVASFNATSLKEDQTDLTTRQTSIGLKLGFTLFF
ncbi:outer membrane beta-barrel protein [Cecembia calidifontis]|jgi:hypothetical protein|uniref:Outer membrane protein beta-barrel domain-containing protein n=1 Tax=Cecembia calidifontis TaxID=1187080 RepID=A0A4Q7P6H8_9BACT|nr:outer membrane beta-barrel protein [Cecembia calidifontis]RZS95686.1 hypothetical protein BC751_1225 [Cecembia calidifontis]